MEAKRNNFFACKYEDEPADLKLLLIYVIKRVRYIIYFAISGALLFASIYYLKTFVFVDEQKYVATSELYLIYSDDVRLENVYINDYTWQKLVYTDRAIDYVMEYIDDARVTEEYLKESVTAGLVSDVRFVTLKVTTDDRDLSIRIAQAYQAAIKRLGEEMVDIDTITVFTEADSAEEVVSDDRTLRMASTGAVVGSILSFLGIILQYVFDDSIYVAKQFSLRYNVPVIGICLKTKKKEMLNENLVGHKQTIAKDKLWAQQAIRLNYRVFTADCKKIVVTDTSARGKNEIPFAAIRLAKMKLEQDELLAIAMGNLREEDAFFTTESYSLSRVASVNEDAEAAIECAEADGVIITVPMGAHNGKLIERAMDFLSKQGCNVVGALLYDGDPALLKMYYFQALPFGSKGEKIEEEDGETVETFNLDDIF